MRRETEGAGAGQLRCAGQEGMRERGLGQQFLVVGSRALRGCWEKPEDHVLQALPDSSCSSSAGSPLGYLASLHLVPSVTQSRQPAPLSSDPGTCLV